MLRVRVGLRHVLALHVQRLETAVERGLEHVRNAQARLGLELHAPFGVEQGTRGRVRHVPVAGEFVRERTHVARTLHVVLAAQRVHAHAFAADIAGGHREIGDAEHHRAALAVLGHAQSVIDRAVAAGGIQTGGAAHQLGRHARDFGQRFRRVLRLRHEVAPFLERSGLAALGDIRLVDEAFRDDDVRDRIDQRDVGAGPQRQVEVGVDVRRVHEVDGTRVGDDQLRAFTQPSLHARREHRMAIGRVGADDENHVALHHRIERLGARGFAERVLQAIPGGGVADAGAGVDVVRAEGRAHELLHQERFLVGAAGRRDAADGLASVLGLDAAELGRGVTERLVPADGLPRIGDLLADHRRGDAIRMRGVAVGEPALDAGVATVRLAVAARHHAHHLLTLDLGFERAADAAIGTGGRDGPLRPADERQRLLAERRRRARLDTGAARDALGIEERLVLARDHARLEAAARDRQRERALHFVTGAHATRTGDAERRLELEIRIAVIAGSRLVVRAIEAVRARRHAQVRGDALQFAVRVGGTALAVEWMVGDVEFDDALAQLAQLVALGLHLHARCDQRRAGRGEAPLTLDFDETDATGTERLQRVGGAELRDRAACRRRCTHDRRARRHGDQGAVDRQRDRLALDRRRARVLAIDRKHPVAPRASAVARKVAGEVLDRAHDRKRRHAAQAAQ